nr:DUF3024 domain-containing protein [Desulfobacteraceae bacterium]
DKPEEKSEGAIAKATRVKSRRPGRTSGCGPRPQVARLPEVKTIEQFLTVVARDEHGCFFG